MTYKEEYESWHEYKNLVKPFLYLSDKEIDLLPDFFKNHIKYYKESVQ